MNTLFVDNMAIGLGDAYRDGARAKRLMKDVSSNPFPLSTPGYQDWTIGFANEERFLHVVDGIDVIEFKGCERSFTAREPEALKSRPKAAYLAYAHSLMIASGALDLGTKLFRADPVGTAASLSRLLAKEGITVHREFAQLIINRIYLESRMQGAPLSPSELDRVQNMGPQQRKFVLTAAKLQEVYYDQSLTCTAMGQFCGENKHWGTLMIKILRRDKMSFIVDSALYKFNLTGKGWEAVRVLRGLLPKAPTAKTSIIPTLTADDDEPLAALRM
jgi:hypothetical protein